MTRYAYCATHGPTDADEGGCLRCQKFRAYSKARRDNLIAKKLCLNGKKHGRAVRNLRCAWCDSVHRLGLEATLASGIKRPASGRTAKREQYARRQS